MKRRLTALLIALAAASFVPQAGAEEHAPAPASTPSLVSATSEHNPRLTGEQAVAPKPQLLSDEEIARRVGEDLQSLGSMSMGRSNRGSLINAVQMPENPRWRLVDPHHVWGTQETVDALVLAINEVHDQFPDSPPMHIGHISRRSGGYLNPHRSHQNGRDADVSYYYRNPKHGWYRRANHKTLDRARTWAFLRALITKTDIKWIFINSSVQRLLKQHALSIGEDPQWLDSVFQYRSRHRDPIIRHVHGHDTHIHVRFFSPKAHEMGRRAYPALIAHGKVAPRYRYRAYRARKGDTLSRLSRRFGTTTKVLQGANGLRSSRIVAGRVYRIPRKGRLLPPTKLDLPARRLPPHPATGGNKTAVAAPDSGSK